MDRAFFHSASGRERVWKFKHAPTGKWIVMDESEVELHADDEEARADEHYEKLIDEFLAYWENFQQRRRDAVADSERKGG